MWRNTLVMGSASGEGWITPPGDIRAYDVLTGKAPLAVSHRAVAG